MKKIISGVIVPVLLAVIIGYVGGKYTFKSYQDYLYSSLSSSRLYLILNGEYDNIDTMREENMGNNYVYYQDSDKYKTVVGITNNYDNIAKIKDLYNDDLQVFEYYVPDDQLNVKQIEYDNELVNAKDVYEIKEVVDNILELYRNDDNVRLIQID